MEPETYSLRITLGNDAMQTPHDVARALETAASLLRDRDEWDSDIVSDIIRDANGNTVGHWQAE